MIAFSVSASAVSLVYTDPAGRMMYQPEGAPARVVQAKGAYTPMLSPDGKLLLFTRNDLKAPPGPERIISLYETATGKTRDLINGLVTDLHFSPDSSRVAFLKYFKKDKDAGWQMWVMPAADLLKATLVSPVNMDAILDWTPDSKSILAVTTGGTVVVWLTPDGKQLQTKKVEDVWTKDWQWQSADVIRFDPANPQRMLMSVYYNDPPKGTGDWDPAGQAAIVMHDWKTNKKTILSDPKIWSHDAVWTPDGKWIYYTRRITEKKSEIWRMHSDGSGQERIVAGEKPAVGN